MVSNIKKIFIGLCIAGSVFASTRTIKHPTCSVYLPTTDTLTSWAGLSTYFNEKGYYPIELRSDEFYGTVKPGDMHASINYHFKTEDGVIVNTNRCTVSAKLFNIVGLNPVRNGLLYSGKGEETDWNNSDYFECHAAEDDAFEDLPYCTTF
ncbi:MAG: hypothetical protein AB7F43_07625 [Bacteriovoracia bacterium]